jgi:hypothetical protein
MEKRKYIVLLAAMLLVIGAPSLLFAGGGIPTATDESFRVGEQNCQLNVGFSQLNDYIRYFSATPAFSTEKGDICSCGEGCSSCYGGGGFASLALAKPAEHASGTPDWCNTGAVQVGFIDDTYVCEKKDCKPNKKGTYDCTAAAAAYTDHPYGKCELRNSVHRRTAERLGNNTQICVTDRTGTRICLGTP